MALNLDSNKTAPKVTFNTSKLAQGLSINLSKSNPNLRRVAVKINWVGDDLDISAVGLDEKGKALLRVIEVSYQGRKENVPQDLIFYMNLQQNGIKHGGDLVSSGDLETEAINVSAIDLDKEVFGLDFIVTSHVADANGKPLLFADVRAMQAELVDLDTNEVVYTTELDCSTILNQSGAIFANLTRKGNEWSYTTKTKGIGKNAHGAQNILTHYYG